MGRLLKIPILQGVLIFSIVFLLAGFAQADPGNHAHPHHQAIKASPFDKLNSDKPLHCLLNAHLHNPNQNCPHKANRSKKSKSAELRADCGSSPAKSDGISFANDLPGNTQTDEFLHHLAPEPLIPQTTPKVRLFPHSIERPPQLS